MVPAEGEIWDQSRTLSTELVAHGGGCRSGECGGEGVGFWSAVAVERESSGESRERKCV